MAEVLLSGAERTFILHGVQDNLRVDGRGCEDFRPMELETDVVSNASGSARVRLANTDILVGVKSEMAEPLPDRPSEGRIEFFVDCSANATPAFEGRGGENLAMEISNMLSRSYDNQTCLDLAGLCMLPRKQCWILYVDILLLECGGNLFDAISVAVKAALYNTRIPNVTVSTGETGDTELEISDDPYDCKTLDVSHLPCIVTLNKIGHFHVVDASMEEEACCIARLMMAVTSSGTVMALAKSGTGSLDPDSILDMMESGKRVGQQLNQVLVKQLQQEQKLGTNRQQVGFLR